MLEVTWSVWSNREREGTGVNSSPSPTLFTQVGFLMPLPAWSCAKCRLLALAASLLCAFTACVAREQIPLHQLQDQLVRFNLSTLSRPNRESFVRELDQAHDVWRVNKAYVDVHTTVDQASWQANELPPYQVLTDNVASYLAGRTNLSDRDAAPTKDFHSTYHSLDAIQAFMQLLAADYSDMANIITVSTSAEGRPIKALKVSRESDYQKKGFLIIGGQHAREWISTASVLYLMHTLLVEGSKNSQSREAVEDALDLYDFTFVPTINPDGYAYSFDSQDGDRLWRKTRGDVGKGCRGIDLNRNWDHHFTASPKPNPCSDSFGGLSPFEAPELQGMRSYMLDKTNNLDVFIDLHSFGQLIGVYSLERS